MTNHKRQILIKRITCVVYFTVKLRQMGQKIRENLKIASLNPKVRFKKKGFGRLLASKCVLP